MSEVNPHAPNFDQASLEALPIAVWETDLEGLVTTRPSGGAVVADVDAWSPWTGRKISDIPGLDAAFSSMTREAIRGNRDRQEVTHEGSTYLLTIGPRLDAGGKVVGTLGFAIDITEITELKADISVRKDQLRVLVDTALDAVITCDTNSVIIDWNKEAEDLFGWKRSEAIGLRLSDTIIPEELRATHQEGMRRYMQTGDGPVLGRRIELEAIDRNGRRFPVELGINPIRSGDGVVFSAFLRDITERVGHEQRLLGNEYRLRSALAAMEAGAWDYRLDVDGRLADASADDRARALLGDDAKILPIDRESVISEDQGVVAEAWQAHLAGTLPRYAVEYRRTGPDGEIQWRRELGMCVFDVDDDKQDFAGKLRHPLRVIGVVTDISPSKAMEASLLDARKLEVAGQIASQFAHDLNNVLTAISGHVSLLELDDLSTRARDSASVIKEAVARGGTLTRNMLQIGRPAADQKSEVDIRGLVEDTSRLAKAILGNQIELGVRIPEDLPTIFVDGDQLQQGILNLLINSRDAMGGKGSISVTVESQATSGGSEVVIEVADDGPGMSPDVLKNAIKPFFTTKGTKGTGLGLAMIDRLMKSERGRLDIESIPNEGTRIRLVIPGVDSSPGASTKNRVQKVMVVEDHPLLRPMLSEALVNAGCVTEAYGEGADALDGVVAFEPDLLVVDVNLPGQCGDELAGELRRKLGSDVPVLFITGNRDFTLPDWPAVDLILKPFELVEFTRKVIGSSFG